MRRVLVVLASALALAAMVIPAAGSQAASPQGANGRIAFTRGGNIWTVNPDGTGARQLTRGHNSGQPVWSPAAQRIAFVRYGTDLPGYGNAVYVMRADGSRVHRISGALRGAVQHLRWSPSGRWVAFVDDLVDASPRTAAILKARADGSVQRRLTRYGSLNGDPSWSPDGTAIYFDSNRDGDEDVYVMDARGKGATNLSANQARDLDPVVSPDGTMIAFVRTVPAPGGEGEAGAILYVMPAAGGSETALTDGSRFDRMPVWSPDGSRLAFTGLVITAGPSTNPLYVIGVCGAGLAKVSGPDLDLNGPPAWSADSTTLAFADQSGDVWTVMADGSNLTALAARPVFETSPDW